MGCARDVMPAKTVLDMIMLSLSTASAALPWNDVNLLIVTDVHSWIGGHTHSDHAPVLDANYGDVLSLYERLSETASKAGHDLFFVQNGDLNDGTGFSRVPPSALVPLLQQMPFDALTSGNHELYKDQNIAYLARPGGFIDSWKGAFLTANVLNATTRHPLGARSKLLVGRATGVRVLAMGFLYDMKDHADDVTVTLVEDVVKEAWFIHALNRTGAYDALLFLSHMDYKDPLVDIIHRAARAIIGESVPIQFVTGHSHIRAYRDLDLRAASFEAGHYLDTIGFASFALDGASTRTSFAHVDIDANVAAMAAAAGLAGPLSLPTRAGRALSERIVHVASSLGLDTLLGCSPASYHAHAALDSPVSLWALYLHNVTAYEALGGNASRIVLESTGSLRYDLFAGNVTTNDLWTMVPFADRFWRVALRVSGDVLAAVVRDLNAAARDERSDSRLQGRLLGGRGPRDHTDAVSSGLLPAYATTSTPMPGTIYELWTLDFDRTAVVGAFEARAKQRASPQLMLGGENTTSIWQRWIQKTWPC